MLKAIWRRNLAEDIHCFKWPGAGFWTKDKQIKADILFDSCSDKSYISSTFVVKKNPKFSGQNLVSVALLVELKLID